MIKQIYLQHPGGLYYYRCHNIKIDRLVSFPALKQYLHDMFDKCPNEYFNGGPRSSMLKFKLDNLDLRSVSGHEVNSLARNALKHSNEESNHSKVESYMLEHDSNTIAVEVPLWLHNNEIANFKELFKEVRPLTGHVDVLRIEDGKVWIWDYKPNAHREKYAATQIFFYALMMSKRTGIGIEHFRCGYFDDRNAFVYKPEIQMAGSYELKDFI